MASIERRERGEGGGGRREGRAWKVVAWERGGPEGIMRRGVGEVNIRMAMITIGSYYDTMVMPIESIIVGSYWP